MLRSRHGPSWPGPFVVLVLSLSVTQIIGWATMFSSPAILARPIADEFNVSLAFGLAGSSFFLVAFALASRPLAPLYQRVGAGPILVAGSIGASAAFVLLGFAQSAWHYAGAFVLLGIAGAAALSTSANTLLTEYAGKDAKRAIITVMLGSGLSSSIGFPILAVLIDQWGWRAAVLAFALAHLLVCAPLHALAARQVVARGSQASAAQAPIASAGGAHERTLFQLLAIAVSAIGFVTWGFAVVVVELFRAFGLDAAVAIAFASVIGIVQVGARLLEFTFLPNLQATRSAIVAAMLFPLSFIALIVLQGHAGAAVFVILFGAASGAMSIARATLPLELFDPRHYGAMAARLALPMNLAFAAAPFAFGTVIETAGPLAASGLAMASALLALIALILLRRFAYPRRLQSDIRSD